MSLETETWREAANQAQTALEDALVIVHDLQAQTREHGETLRKIKALCHQPQAVEAGWLKHQILELIE